MERPGDRQKGDGERDATREQEQDKKHLEEAIMEEVIKHAFGPVTGFFDKFFHHARTGHHPPGGANGSELPQLPSGGFGDIPYRLWLLKMRFLQPTSARNIFFFPFEGDDSLMLLEQNRLHQFPSQQEPRGWNTVQGVGYFHHTTTQQGERGYNITGVQRLYAYALEVFTAQPTRLFLHCFLACDGVVQPWLFDRTGLYSCERFDMNSLQTDHLIQSYTVMSKEELGLNPNFSRGVTGEYALFDDGKICRGLGITGSPLKLPRKIVDTRTSVCLKACIGPPGLGKPAVIKLKWQKSYARGREESMMKLAAIRHMKGVSKLHLESTQATMAKLHSNLDISTAPNMWGAERTVRGTTTDLELHALVISPLGRPLEDYKDEEEFLFALRDAIVAHKSLYFDGGILHRDISPGNIVITTDGTPGAGFAGGRSGALIDLDRAIKAQYADTGRGQAIGTRAFRSLGVVRGDTPTCRHELESFFYVFLWQALTGKRDRGKRKACRLDFWACPKRPDAHTTLIMACDMLHAANFAAIIEGFQPEFVKFTALAWQWRSLLFFSEWSTISPQTVQPFCGARLHKDRELYDAIVETINWTLGIRPPPEDFCDFVARYEQTVRENRAAASAGTARLARPCFS